MALSHFQIQFGPFIAETVALLGRLGKHTTGKGCLYIKKLADVDLAVFEALIALNWERMNAQYPV